MCITHIVPLVPLVLPVLLDRTPLPLLPSYAVSISSLIATSEMARISCSPASPPGSNRSTTFLVLAPRLGSPGGEADRDMISRFRGMSLVFVETKEERKEERK
jgi:hypothetical protein